MTNVAESFRSASEELHARFIELWKDEGCVDCRSSAMADGMLAAWIQNEWGEFVRRLIVVSAMGFRRLNGADVEPIGGVNGVAEAEAVVKDAAKIVSLAHRMCSPVWHANWFVVEVGSQLGLHNQQRLEETVGATPVPGQINVLRNVLVHPGDRNRRKYEVLQAKLGMLNVAPEMLAREMKSPGLPMFTFWVKELQRVADVSVQ